MIPLILQPDKAILVVIKDGELGKRHFEVLSTEHTSSMMEWGVINVSKSKPVPLEFKTNNQPNSEAMFNITMPYLEGVRFSELAKILDDEEDLISSLRVSILDAINELEEGVDCNVIARDIIDPKIDILARKFKLIVSSQKFRIAGAAVGSVAMAYTAVATAGVSMGMLGAAGGLGLLGREYSLYRDKTDKFKDDPYYFLWRCKQLSK